MKTKNSCSPGLKSKFFYQEVDIVSRLNHPSILKFYGYSLTDFKNKLKPVIIFENLSNKSIYYHITSNDLSDTQKYITIYGIALGMSYLHSHNILHRNLNIRNIFFDDFFYPKITGFNYSIQISDKDIVKASNLYGISGYLAPEILSNLEYSKSSDVYSFSIIMYQIITNKEDFETKFYDNFKHPYFEEPINEAYQQLIERCWSYDPKLRPTFDEILNELRTNPNFITEKIDKNEYQKYIEYIEKSPISFNTNKERRYIDLFLESKTEKIDLLKIQQIQNHSQNSYFNLTKYKKMNTPNFHYDEYDIYTIFSLNKNDKEQYSEEYKAQFYNKEINNFNKNEIINLYHKLNVLSQINHPAILSFVGYSPVDYDNKPKPVIVTERCCNEFKKVKGDSTKILIVIYGIASAMAYLHSHDILHRDLNLDNIYLDDYDLPKITGFDISFEMNNIISEENGKIKGTPLYIAPETYLNKEYSKASDVYSFSLIMYRLITGNKPYNEFISPIQIRKYVAEEGQRPQFCSGINNAFRSLIERCWSQEPKQRPTFEEIIKELQTNPDFITEEIDKEKYFNYIKCLKEYPISFNSDKRIKQFDDIISSRINTFADFKNDVYVSSVSSTEKNDISFGYDFFYYNRSDYKILNEFKGFFYAIIRILQNIKTHEIIVEKIISYTYPLTKSISKNFSHELNIIPHLIHPSILKFIGYDPYSSIFVEYASKGPLSQYIQNFKDSQKSDIKDELNETQKLIIIYGIASAMSFLHSHNIIHRDLKPSNILIDDSYNPKLSGLELVKRMKNEIFDKSSKIKGTPAYIAPETYLNKEYSKASDVYSFSLIMYEILTMNKPYNEFISPIQIKKYVAEEGQRPQFCSGINNAFRSLIERCWSQEPKQRPTFEEIIKELQTNPDFITEEIDKEKYFNYIKMIENSEVKYDLSKKEIHVDNLLELLKYHSVVNDAKINLASIYDTELNDVLFNYDFIDINEFEKEGLYNFDIKSRVKINRIIDKKSKKMYLSKISFDISRNFDSKNIYNIFIWNQFNKFISLNHPSIIKIIGFSPIKFKNKPGSIIVQEYASNKTLHDILEIEIENKSKKLINDTKRLIILYGIASGMYYLHSHNYIHTNLQPSEVFLDDFLFPKIEGFRDYATVSNNPIPDLSLCLKRQFFHEINIYKPPEQLLYYGVSTAVDVYAFGMIAYQLITNENPFPEVNKEIIDQICNENLRPKLNDSIPECYCKLIEKCWLKDPKERPTFEEIVYNLKTNKEFINNSINEDEYNSYIDFIDKSQSITHKWQIDDYINSKNKLFRKVQVDFQKIRKSDVNFYVEVGSINLQKYEIEKKIGSGGFAVVYKVQEKITNKLYAAKVSKFNVDYCEDSIAINLSREINIISQLKHTCILQYIGFSPFNFKNKRKPVIFTEYASNGSLDKIIELERSGCANPEWNDTKKLIVIYGIALGMEYLHRKDIIHRDLKPANILLDDCFFPKIADFGMSKVLNFNDDFIINQKKLKSSGFKGTFAYCDPSVIQTQKYDKGGDVYSYGMIVYEIMTTQIPYEGLNQIQLFQKLSQCIHPKFKYPIPICYRKLIEKCWESVLRPDFKTIVKSLETDKGFITPNVDEEEYLNYVSLMKEINSSNKGQEEQQNIPKNISKNIYSFNKVSLDSKILEKNEFDLNLSNEAFLDLSKYTKLENVAKNDFFKLFIFKNNETDQFYFGQMSMIPIKPIRNDDIFKLTKELKKIKELNHPTLLKFIGYSPIDFKKQRKPVIITEYASNGSLEYILENERNNKSIISSWNETKKLIVIYGIALGMSYLHSHDIIHGSLKPCNIYLDEILTPKLGDFGLSTRFKSSESITIQSISGTKAAPIYSSPEVIKYNKYSKSSDVYSFSLIVYEILHNKIPFDEIENKNFIINEVVNEGRRPKIKENLPKSYRNLIEKCWSQNPDDRPQFNVIVELLRKDKGFITEKINDDHYQQYIKSLDSQIETINNMKIEEREIKKISKVDIENLAIKYTIENDPENVYKYFKILIKSGKCKIPIEYATQLYKMKHYKHSFRYFNLINETRNPISQYFIAVMKFYGQGCEKNLNESYQILKNLSQNGIDKATEFLEEHF